VLVMQLLSHVFDNQVMDLLFWYIDLHQNSDVRLAFEALKVIYLFNEINQISILPWYYTVVIS